MRLLDLFACEGGATAGYQWAGWHVTAVDLDKNRLSYNPADVTVHADALDYLAENAHRFDAVHMSPPCQWYTRGNAKDRGKATKWERSIPTARDAVLSTGLPYVLENVEDAAWDMRDPITLCGCMFGLSVRDRSCNDPGNHEGVCDTKRGVVVRLLRPRLFETNWGLPAKCPCDHSQHEWVAGAYGGARRDKWEAKYVRKGGYVPPIKADVAALLGVEHDMTWQGLFECLPPAYTSYIGRRLARHLEAVAA